MTKTWGPCTWYLFHTLAEKIKEEYFSEHKNELISLFVNICSNLPCPECAHHAGYQMSKLKSQNITTKQQLKEILYSFHNIVNYFIQIWNKRSHNPKLMIQDLHKSRLIKEFIKWWNTNNYLFD